MKITDGLDDNQLASLRETSRLLLGNKYRLEVALAVAESESGRVFAHALVDAISGLADHQAGKELGRLEGTGLVKREAREDGQARIYFVRQQSRHWELCEELARETIERARTYAPPRLVIPEESP